MLFLNKRYPIIVTKNPIIMLLMLILLLIIIRIRIRIMSKYCDRNRRRFENGVRRQVLGSASLCSRSSSARNWNKLRSRQRKYSRQSFINKAWLILFHVTCATRIMLATLSDIFTIGFKQMEKKIGGPWELMLYE